MKARFSLLVVALLLTGCGYFNEVVNPSEIGVQVKSGKIFEVVGPGIYTDFWDIYADFHRVSLETLTFSVADPEVATSDNQLVGITITVQARRKGDKESITNLFTNWPALRDNTNLQNTISATALEGIKVGVRQFNLEGLLTDRNGLANSIQAALEEDAAEYSAEIVNVTVENIALSPEYAAQLQLNAQYTAQIEGLKKQQEQIAIQAETDRIKQEQAALVYAAQLEAEQAKTAVEVEIAEREGKKTAAAQQVFADNPQAFHLKELELLSEVLDGQTVYFVPDLNALTLLLTQSGTPTVVPVPSEPQ